ncbi:MAG: OmpA family protein [Paludibacteraceae bacterium]
MNNKTIRHNNIRLIAAIFFAVALSANTLATVPKPVFLEKAQKAYEQNLFDVAAHLYESYLQNSNDKSNNEVLLQLADSYWQMRKYRKAYEIYNKIAEQDKSNILPSDRIRIANLQARYQDFKNAASWLDNQTGYESRKASFLDRSAVDYLTEDSVDWKVEPINIDTHSREFSPVIYKDKLIFTSNRPENKEVQANGWDGNNFTKLWIINEKNIAPLFRNNGNARNIKVVLGDGNAPSNNVTYDLSILGTKSNNYVAGKKMADVFEDSDTKPFEKQTDNEFEKLTGKLSIEKTTLVSLLNGLGSFKYNVSTPSFDSDDNIYFSANEPLAKNQSQSNIILYQGKINDVSVINIQPITIPGFATSGNKMHPAVNKEGTKLIFASNAMSENDAYDLYLIEKNGAMWSTPQRLSESINTVGNEVFPTIGEDGYLYFSSDGRGGYGGLDIFKIKMNEITSSNPNIELLGYPINSCADDFGLIINHTGTIGYFTSDRQVDNDNIFSFAYKPLPKISHISGLVKERKNREILPGATVFLLNRQNNEVLVDKADSSGRYTFDVYNLGDYTIRGIEENYKDDCLSMNIFSEKPKDVTFQVRDLILELTFKKVWTLDNLLYDFDKWNIRKNAEPPLDSLIMILNTYPIKVELGSHTDSRGSDSYNLKLSQRRAESAVNYIVKKGKIASDRIVAKGYGETKLENRCANGIDCDEEEHQQNRRTEITVLYNPAPANSLNPTKYQKGQKLTVNDFPKGYFEDCK